MNAVFQSLDWTTVTDVVLSGSAVTVKTQENPVGISISFGSSIEADGEAAECRAAYYAAHPVPAVDSINFSTATFIQILQDKAIIGGPNRIELEVAHDPSRLGITQRIQDKFSAAQTVVD